MQVLCEVSSAAAHDFVFLVTVNSKYRTVNYPLDAFDLSPIYDRPIGIREIE